MTGGMLACVYAVLITAAVIALFLLVDRFGVLKG